MLGALRELGVALVPFSPLGRGMLSGYSGRHRVRRNRFSLTAAAVQWPCLGGESQATVDTVVQVAGRHGVTPLRVALAWVQGRSETLGVPVVPIPGTKRVRYLEENVAALDLRLSPDDLVELDAIADRVVGARY